MSWEKFETSFPSGAQTIEYDMVTAEQLRANPDIIAITVPLHHMARDMQTDDCLYIFGANNEYAVKQIYNVYDGVIHLDRYHYPLNVYGAAMVQDYLDFNYIPDLD